ncbi:MAG: hypothetical protein WC623_22470 [Pedobacter sp.]|uniref:hypothetical protein n=1 Tax=Pedobacter sp. TaxID=1411316 RepID=UPI00356348B2
MITRRIGENITIGLFQKDQLVFLEDEIQRMVFNHDEMNEICKIWTEFTGKGK